MYQEMMHNEYDSNWIILLCPKEYVFDGQWQILHVREHVTVI